MIHFLGAGPGAPDLITVRGKMLLETADQIIYAGSLVNPALLSFAASACVIRDSATMTLEEVIAAMADAERAGLTTVRLHTGDPSLYGAIAEQMRALDSLGIAYDVTPGVSSASAAAAVLGAEYTLPDVSQTFIITREAGRTPTPERESLAELAAHQTSMVLFLSAGLADEVQRDLLAGGYDPMTPVAIVYRVSWPEERVLRTTVGALAKTMAGAGITSTALILVGDFLQGAGARSRLYDPAFSTGFRAASASVAAAEDED